MDNKPLPGQIHWFDFYEDFSKQTKKQWKCENGVTVKCLKDCKCCNNKICDKKG